MIVTITEPTTNSDGTPLQDLHSLVVFTVKENAGLIRINCFAASSPEGGGNHALNLDGIEGSLTIQSFAFDRNGKQSEVATATVEALNPKPSAPQLEVQSE